MGLVRSFIGTDGIWQYIPHINTGLFSIIKVHFLLFANLIVDWHINTINFTDSGLIIAIVISSTLPKHPADPYLNQLKQAYFSSRIVSSSFS